MTNFVKELSELPQIGDEPAFFWLRDFEQLSNTEQAKQLGVDNLTFNDQVNFALSIPQLSQVYGQDIVRDPESGNITASRTFLYLREIDMFDINNQLEMLYDQREITMEQTMNKPPHKINGELSFFSFDEMYFFWEIYSTVVDELIFTTISCVIVISVLTLLFIPHWTAVAFVCPLLIMLYFNMLGKFFVVTPSESCAFGETAKLRYIVTFLLFFCLVQGRCSTPVFASIVSPILSLSWPLVFW